MLRVRKLWAGLQLSACRRAPSVGVGATVEHANARGRFSI
jgi:hypothetical protein